MLYFEDATSIRNPTINEPVTYSIIESCAISEIKSEAGGFEVIFESLSKYREVTG